MLDFIEGDRRVEAGNEAVGIALGSRQNAGVVEGEILALFPACRAPLTKTAGVSARASRSGSVK